MAGMVLFGAALGGGLALSWALAISASDHRTRVC